MPLAIRFRHTVRENRQKWKNWKTLTICGSEIVHSITRGQSNLTKSASRGPIPRLGVTPGGRNLYHWIPGVGFPISVPWHSNYRPRMHRLATVHANDNQPANQRPTTNDQVTNDVTTQPISISASCTKVKWALKNWPGVGKLPGLWTTTWSKQCSLGSASLGCSLGTVRVKYLFDSLQFWGVFGANDPKREFFGNSLRYVSKGHGFTYRGQIWWKSAVGKLTKLCLVLRTKKPGCAEFVRVPYFAPPHPGRSHPKFSERYRPLTTDLCIFAKFGPD